MNTMLKPSTLFCAAILGVVVLAGGHANADDYDKLPLFNTFYLPGQGGSYALSLRQDRTFTLTDPRGTTVCGTLVASDDELALISSAGNRHFAYRFDSAGDVVFEPTKKDTPNGATVIGRMAPVGRNNEALFVAAQNVSSPVRAVGPFTGGSNLPAVVTTVVRHEEGPRNLMAEGYPGFHAACIPWLHRREVAVVGADTPTDTRPSGYTKLPAPIHQVGIVAMGLWTLDNANLEELAAACERYHRWEF
ncbi:MAG: hypothetical protein HY291_20640, partial [Planctomycetes bacterium]|nr:hypothetical protein [Planctomycetota bacterium]